jgi:hypothetical protein
LIENIIKTRNGPTASLRLRFGDANRDAFPPRDGHEGCLREAAAAEAQERHRRQVAAMARLIRRAAISREESSDGPDRR